MHIFYLCTNEVIQLPVESKAKQQRFATIPLFS